MMQSLIDGTLIKSMLSLRCYSKAHPRLRKKSAAAQAEQLLDCLHLPNSTVNLSWRRA
jgi:hypothetical protein